MLDEKLLAPLIAERDAVQGQLDALKEDVRRLTAEVTTLDRMLKTAGYGTNGAQPTSNKEKKKEKKADTPPSPDAQRRVLDFVAKNITVDAPSTGKALGLSSSYAGKTLSYLRDMEQIRLVRYEPSSADGRGRKPVYGPWIGEQ